MWQKKSDLVNVNQFRLINFSNSDVVFRCNSKSTLQDKQIVSRLQSRHD